MTDYVTLQRRIWHELDRSDITADAQAAIQTAIRFYAHRRFYFNEERWTASTVANQEYYAVPLNFRNIDTLKLTVNTNSYLLTERTWAEIENWAIAASTFTGYPSDFAMQRNEIRLYPIPNAAYTMTLSGLVDLGGLSADATSNAWMTHGEELIRSRASADLLENVLQDYDEPRSALYRGREQDALKALSRESNLRTTTGRSRKARC